jgi:hypothetical protein
MNLMELIHAIQGMSDVSATTRILIASDEEGNSFHETGRIEHICNPIDGHTLTLYPGGKAVLPGCDRIDAYLASLSKEDLLRIISDEDGIEIPAHVFE